MNQYVLIFILSVATIGLGIGAKYLLPYLMPNLSVISWKSVGIAVAISEVLIFSTVMIGFAWARADTLSYNEYYNGYETQAREVSIKCVKNGSCRWTYDCDGYPVTTTSCDADGKNCTTSTHWEYDSCPYVNTEYNYYVDTTLGTYTIAEGRFPDDPNANLYRSWEESVSDRLADKAGVGVPAFWQAANDRINAGKPGPVTKRMTYENYILASEKTILKEYSDRITGYKERGVLPDLQYGIRDFYYANKAYFVGGYSPEDQEVWQNAIMYLNAALGEELQGDFHLVIVQDEEISGQPDGYLTALKAYWQDPIVWGDNAISKNSIIVVVGTSDGQTVSWARATTGMPLGNEAMTTAVSSRLKGVKLTPEALVGNVSGEFYTRESDGKLKVRGLHGKGALERIIWDIDDAGTKFARVSMAANDAEDIGSGFVYLGSEIEPSGGQKTAMFFVGFFLATLAWAGTVGVSWYYTESTRSHSYNRYL